MDVGTWYGFIETFLQLAIVNRKEDGRAQETVVVKGLWGRWFTKGEVTP